jgi:serine/threonine protein kinase
MQVFLSQYFLNVAYEYATHGTLQETLEKYGPFSENFARFFFQQLLCGISYCHGQGVAHCNLRLSKLLLRVYSTSKGAAPVLKISGFEAAVEDPLTIASPKPGRNQRSGSPPKPLKVRLRVTYQSHIASPPV